jgi:hypothetical protein
MAVGELGFVEVTLGHNATRVRGKGASSGGGILYVGPEWRPPWRAGQGRCSVRWESELGSLSGLGGCWKREMTGGSRSSATASGRART